MRVLSLFSGVGLHDLGLERAGFQIAAQVENDPFCRAVLTTHWPEVPRFDDVRTVSADAFRSAGVGRVELVTGGFPCQDISVAGKGAGLDGARSGLWHEMRRIVCEVRPDWVLAENVPRLRTLGADQVLADLDALGYSCWPLVVGAVHAGAPHRRLRVWIVAHLARHGESAQSEIAGADWMRTWAGGDTVRCGMAYSNGSELRHESGRGGRESWAEAPESRGFGATLADGDRDGCEVERSGELLDRERETRGDDVDGRGARRVGDANCSRLAILRGERGDDGAELPATERAGWCDVSDSEGERREEQGKRREQGVSESGSHGTRWPARPGEPQHAWEAPRLTQPGLGRADHGSAGRLDGFIRRGRLHALGNANPPQVVEAVGRAILAAERSMREAQRVA